MRKSLAIVVAILVAASVFVVAQHRQSPDPAEMVQRHVDHMTKELSLSPQQQQQATTLLTQVVNNQKTIHDQMKTAHQNLMMAIKNNDTAAIDQNSSTIGNLTSQQVAAHAKAMATFYQTLTPDQQTKFQDMVHHGMGMGMEGMGMHGHGHGGHEGPPPGASF
jgi:Spy/CpxP family protein refolding chaperone